MVLAQLFKVVEGSLRFRRGSCHVQAQSVRAAVGAASPFHAGFLHDGSFSTNALVNRIPLSVRMNSWVCWECAMPLDLRIDSSLVRDPFRSTFLSIIQVSIKEEI